MITTSDLNELTYQERFRALKHCVHHFKLFRFYIERIFGPIYNHIKLKRDYIGPEKKHTKHMKTYDKHSETYIKYNKYFIDLSLSKKHMHTLFKGITFSIKTEAAYTISNFEDPITKARLKRNCFLMLSNQPKYTVKYTKEDSYLAIFAKLRHNTQLEIHKALKQAQQALKALEIERTRTLRKRRTKKRKKNGFSTPLRNNTRPKDPRTELKTADDPHGTLHHINLN